MGATRLSRERLFGLTNSEANHGEDVKEYYFYLDSTPTHSYLKYLYKYPQAAYPYGDLVATNGGRGRHEAEYELLDTGVFNEDRYFDVFVEYAKASPEDILVEISVYNRGPEAAEIQVLPTLWFRNRWSWGRDKPRPVLKAMDRKSAGTVVHAAEVKLGHRYLYCEGNIPLLFTENETNTQRHCGTPNRTLFVKDGINNCVVHGQSDAVNPQQTGTKVAAQYHLTVEPGKCETVRLRLTTVAPDVLPESGAFGKHFDELLPHAPPQGRRTSFTQRSFHLRSMRTRRTSCARLWRA